MRGGPLRTSFPSGPRFRGQATKFSGSIKMGRCFEQIIPLLSVWCEDLGRLLLLRHQKARNGDSTADTQPAEPSKMHQTLQKPPGPQR
ncbi:hypothetical protein AVEN_208213-1 [Araneus ventricosus]|uniref:Uncharacterized protein n=1 Tax=Araneus ventricosus TaxID=182803 RepID=A0A4Y2LFJ2_ARAVE|nr:hypothetical protein AVEN_208213-1 [Araneus ventricosus]